MNKYKVIRPSYDPDRVYEVEAWDEEDAAKEVCNKHYSRWDYPSGPLFFLVTDAETDISVHVEINIEAVPSFHGEVCDFCFPQHCLHEIRHRAKDGRCYGCLNIIGVVPEEQVEADKKRHWSAYREKWGGG